MAERLTVNQKVAGSIPAEPELPHQPLTSGVLLQTDKERGIMANVNKQKIKKKEDRLSSCCGAAPVGLIVDGLAICSRCKEWADFDELEIFRETDKD